MTLFADFYSPPRGSRYQRLMDLIRTALDEDGPDMTSGAVFGPHARLRGAVVAKQELVVAGGPLIALVFSHLAQSTPHSVTVSLHANDGERVEPGTVLAHVEGPANEVLTAERVMLNLLGHASGIATQTRTWVDAMGDSTTRLLDTRKTQPGLRLLEKYAVRCGGGHNHRMDLSEMLMLKDTHIDGCGSITNAVARLRAAYTPCPPIEVECRTAAEVAEAVAADVERIMLDNMDEAAMMDNLRRIPNHIETEISGNVTLARIPRLARLGADFISAGALTHSAPVADISLRILA